MFYIAQAIIIGYTISMALFQSPIVTGMRTYWPQQNKYSRPFHRFGWAVGCVVAIPLVLLQQGWQDQLLTGLLCAFWYSLLFDIIIGWKVFSNPYYLGSTSILDKEGRLLGKQAGKIKMILCMVVILLGNILHYLIPFFFKS